MRRHKRLLRSRRDDSGYGLLIVIAISMVITLMVGVSLSMARNTIQSGKAHTTYNLSLDAAEAGVDLVLGLLKTNQSYSAGPDLPSNCWLSGLTTDSPCLTDEKTWVRQQLTTLAATASNRVKTSQGEFVAIKPAHARAVYSMGFVPDYATATRTRILKAEYLFSTYAPADAILTGATADISGSFTVGVVSGSPPPSVHSNEDLTHCPSSFSITGGAATATTASGTTNDCGGIINAPREDVPAIDPRSVYSSEWSKYATTWYDLCPDGRAYKPSAAGPCSGQAQGVLSPLYLGSSPFRGWTYKSSSNQWSDGGGTNSSGIFYVYRADTDMTKADSVTQTVITEATENRACPKTTGDGDLHIKQTDVTNFMPGLVLLAGNRLDGDAQSSASRGLVAAQETISQSTSSALGVIGAVIAENSCDSAATPQVNSFQGSGVTYDGTIDIPLGQTVRTSLELEL